MPISCSKKLWHEKAPTPSVYHSPPAHHFHSDPQHFTTIYFLPVHLSPSNADLCHHLQQHTSHCNLYGSATFLEPKPSSTFRVTQLSPNDKLISGGIGYC